MSFIASFDGPGAPERTVRCAEKAEQAGFEDVETHYLPGSGKHTVTGALPEQAGCRTVDAILGR